MRISGMATTRDIGDEAVSVTTRHVDQRGLYERRVVAARTGTVVATWAARSPAGSPPISAGVLLRLLGGSVNTVCPRSAGSCAARPYHQISRIPPAEPRAAGFLSPVDLPVFEGLTRRWTATQVKATGANRASTRCDRANFADARARWIRSRSYVPGGGNNPLPAIFGMTESVGRFASVKATTAFVRGVVSAVDTCSGAPRTVTSDGVDPVRLKRGTGFRWDVSVRTAPGTTVVYRSGLVRVGESVAQVTFTPTGDHDITAAGHVGLLSRAAERLTQLGR
jgi:hypothetical protein